MNLTTNLGVLLKEYGDVDTALEHSLQQMSSLRTKATSCYLSKGRPPGQLALPREGGRATKPLSRHAAFGVPPRPGNVVAYHMVPRFVN